MRGTLRFELHQPAMRGVFPMPRRNGVAQDDMPDFVKACLRRIDGNRVDGIFYADRVSLHVAIRLIE
jgi:hypothetical protein